jgi:hypothetical protein
MKCLSWHDLIRNGDLINCTFVAWVHDREGFYIGKRSEVFAIMDNPCGVVQV